MKKLISVLLTLSILLCCTACGDNQKSSSEPSDSVLETTTEEVTEPETTTENTITTIITMTTSTTVNIEDVTELSTEKTSAMNTTENTTEQNNIDISDIDEVSVDTDEETITIVLPSSFIANPDSIISDAQNDDRIISCTLNEDESVTYVITKNGYSDFLNELSTSIDESLNQVISSDSYPNIVGIEHNLDFTDITINITDEESFSKSTDGFAVVGVMMLAGSYQIFDGKEQANCTIHYIDSYGNEVKTSYFPE